MLTKGVGMDEDKHEKAGRARAESQTPEERRALAKKAAAARWEKRRKERHPAPSGAEKQKAVLPVAQYKGVLPLGGVELPCYVLDNDRRVIGRTSFTEAL